MYERELRRDWAILGVESILIGVLTYYSRLNDTNMHIYMQIFAEPYLIFAPFILGILSFVIATVWQQNVKMINITLISSVMYWSAFMVLITINSIHEGQSPTLGAFGFIVVIRILNMAYMDNHGADI